MKHRKQGYLNAFLFCLIAAVILLIVMMSNTYTVNGQGYPGPTAYPGPATNTPEPMPTETAQPTPTGTPGPTGTPVCGECEPTGVGVTGIETRAVTAPIWVIVLAFVLVIALAAVV